MPIYPYSFTLPPVNKQDIPSDGVAGEFLGISAGGVLDWLPVSGGSGSGDLLAANNLSELTATAGTARTNLGLGTGDSPTFKNLVISTGSITTSAPVTISQTWSTTGTYTAAKIDVTETATANPLSKLLDLQVGGASKFSVEKNVNVIFRNNAILFEAFGAETSAIQYIGQEQLVVSRGINGSKRVLLNNVGVFVGNASAFGFASTGEANATADTILVRDGAANTLALRNGAAAQTFRVYGSYTDASNYTRGQFEWSGGTFYVSTANAGTGVAAPLGFWVAGGERMRVLANGNVGIGTTAPTANLHVAGADGDQTTKRVALFQSNDGNIQNDFSVVGITSSDSTVNTFQHRLLDLDYASATLGSTGTYIRMLRGGTEFAGIGLASDEFVITTGATEKIRVSAAGNVGIGTTAPSSKLHVVGDAVLTGDLLGTNYTIGVPTILTQSNISITNTHSAVADSAIVITPKGTGAFILGPKPDGTATGGNARGTRAVDLQLIRDGSTQVASGNVSVICGGNSNICSGEGSCVGGGTSNQVTSQRSVISGGLSNLVTGIYAVVVGGQTNTSSGIWSSVAGGQNNTASSNHSFISGGYQALADRNGLSAHAAGRFAANGDAQKTTAVFRNKTTTNSAVELFLDGASVRYTVTSGKVISMLINITGTKSDGSAVAHYVRQYSIKNVGGTTSEVYAAVTVGTDNAAGTSIALSADNTNDSLKIEVTGVTSETWRWVASVDAVEVGYGV
jgi:hypothetical protein